MKKTIFVLPILLSVYASCQNIEFSHNIGEIDCSYTYKKLKKAIGEPDSIYKELKPYGKALPYYKMFYDNNNFVVQYMLNPFEKFTDKKKDPTIYIYANSKFKINGLLLSEMDTTTVIQKFGKPNNINDLFDEITLSYNFTREKKFCLVTFYFEETNKIKKIWIIYGKY